MMMLFLHFVSFVPLILLDTLFILCIVLKKSKEKLWYVENFSELKNYHADALGTGQIAHVNPYSTPKSVCNWNLS